MAVQDNPIVQLLLESGELVDMRQDIVTYSTSTLIPHQRQLDDEIIVHIVYRAKGEDEP